MGSLESFIPRFLTSSSAGTSEYPLTEIIEMGLSALARRTTFGGAFTLSSWTSTRPM